MIFADSGNDKHSKLPKWILQLLLDGYLNLSTDMALQHIKQFLCLTGQPIDQVALQSVLLTLEEVNVMNRFPANYALSLVIHALSQSRELVTKGCKLCEDYDFRIQKISKINTSQTQP